MRRRSPGPPRPRRRTPMDPRRTQAHRAPVSQALVSSAIQRQAARTRPADAAGRVPPRHRMPLQPRRRPADRRPQDPRSPPAAQDHQPRRESRHRRRPTHPEHPRPAPARARRSLRPDGQSPTARSSKQRSKTCSPTPPGSPTKPGRSNAPADRSDCGTPRPPTAATCPFPAQPKPPGSPDSPSTRRPGCRPRRKSPTSSPASRPTAPAPHASPGTSARTGPLKTSCITYET